MIKIKLCAVNAGKEVISSALALYYTAYLAGTPIRAKLAIFSALAYFISPVDFIPDVIPMLGYSDDVGVLTAVLKELSRYVVSIARVEAEKKLKLLFD